MNYLLDVIACGLVTLGEILGVIAIAMLVQGIVYWTTGFSIYNAFIKIAITDQLKK